MTHTKPFFCLILIAFFLISCNDRSTSHFSKENEITDQLELDNEEEHELNSKNHVINRYRSGSGILTNILELGSNNKAGRTLCILIDKADTNHLIVGTDRGGMWNSYNRGVSWQSVDDFAPVMHVSSMSQDPFNPSHIYACTESEIEDANGDFIPDIYVSTDFGQTFNLASSTNQATTPIVTNKILTSPHDSGAVYMLSKRTILGYPYEQAIIRTYDAGNTFETVASSPLVQQDAILDFCLLPDGSVCYVTESRFYKSPNGNVGTYVTIDSTSFSNISKARIEFAPSSPDSLYLLAKPSSGAYVVMLSSTGGQGWSNTASGATVGTFGNLLKVRPGDPSMTFVGLVGLNTSQNSGGNWYTFTHSGVDYWNMVFDPDLEDAFVVNDGGVAKYDMSLPIDPFTYGSNKVTHLDSLLSNTMIHAGDYPDNGYGVVAGFQDIGTNWRANSNSNFFTSILGGDGSYCFFNRNDSTEVYASSQNGKIYKVNIYDPFSFSTPSQLVLNELDTNANNVVDEGALFIHPFWVNYSDGDQLFYPTRKRLWRSIDGATSWQPVSNAFANQTTNSLKIDGFSSSNPTVVWTVGSTIYGLRNASTANASDVKEFTPSTTNLSDFHNVKISALNDSVIYTVSTFWNPPIRISRIDGLFGNNPIQTDISGDLPYDVEVRCVQPSALNDSVIVLGTSHGLWSTCNGGVNWVREEDFPYVWVNRIKVRPSDNKLFIFTYGRGAWAADFPEETLSVSEHQANLEFTIFPNPSATDWLNVEIDGSPFNGKNDLYLEVYSLTGKRLMHLSAIAGKINRVDIRSLPAGGYIIVMKDSTGRKTAKRFIRMR